MTAPRSSWWSGKRRMHFDARLEIGMSPGRARAPSYQPMTVRTNKRVEYISCYRLAPRYRRRSLSPIPTVTSLARQPLTMKINPLPAIFPPSLGATARTAGKKGVLHTIWAKKRLQVLRKEIETESKTNVEGVGLNMALQEKEWIEENFGIAPKPTSISIPTVNESASGAPLSPMTPRSPGGGRLSEKLKGLKLGTTEQELSKRNDGEHITTCVEGWYTYTLWRP